MDYGHNDSEPRRSGSFSRISSTNSSLRRHSFNLVGAIHHDIDDDSDCRSVSEAGDIGDRALHSKRYNGSVSSRSRFSFDNNGENLVVPIQEDSFKESQLPTASPASPDSLLHDQGQNKVGLSCILSFSIVMTSYHSLRTIHYSIYVGYLWDTFMCRSAKKSSHGS